MIVWPEVYGQTVTINRLYSEKEFLCPGDEVIFVCRTVGSQTLEWRSDQYTDTSFLLKFASHDPVGRIFGNPTNQDISANLTNSFRDDDGVLMMESQLRIRVKSNTSSTFYVKCLLDNLGTDIITLRVLGMCTYRG